MAVLLSFTTWAMGDEKDDREDVQNGIKENWNVTKINGIV